MAGNKFFNIILTNVQYYIAHIFLALEGLES